MANERRSNDDESEAGLREQMVLRDLLRRDIADPDVLNAFRAVPRTLFIPGDLQGQAYCDRPLPIGHGQTISQPYIVAYMLQLLELCPEDKTLEIGSGSGYQTALLTQLCRKTYGLEICRPLTLRARRTLQALGGPFEARAEIRTADGYAGLPEEAPFDAIILSCAPKELPQPLIDQLGDNGRLVAPVGGPGAQVIVKIRKMRGKLQRTRHAPVLFVPMTGLAERVRPRSPSP